MKCPGNLIEQFMLIFLFALHDVYGNPLTGCPMPKELQNGKLIYEMPGDEATDVVPSNYILRFECDRGYERIGPQFLFCGSENAWNGELPICAEMQCHEPPAIENGEYEILIGSLINPVVGSTANYSCYRGFEMVNKNETSLKCILRKARPVWKGKLPVCAEKDYCEDPGTSPDGKRKGSCCFVGDHLSYDCNSGFELVGEKEIFCGRGGIWSSPRPTCRPSEGSCENPPIIPNGHVEGYNDGDHYAAFDEVQVVCDAGYAHFGESKYIMCEEDFQWEFDFGNCEQVFCDVPAIPENGTILEVESSNATTFPYGAFLNYVCDIGFRLGGSSSRMCGEDGNWEGSEPRCEPTTCYDPGVPENGMRNGDDFTVGAKVTFSCFSGFDLIGSVERFCLPNGQWNGVLARCDLDSNYCPNPGVPINGIKVGHSYEKGDKVEFRCLPEFSLIGSQIRECLADGTWSGEEAKCLGPRDYDNTAEVSDMLKETIIEKAEEQAENLRKYYHSIDANAFSINGTTRLESRVQKERILTINHSERLVLYFLFDVSGSVGKKNFKISIDFAKALVKKIGISPEGARAGVMTFSSKAEIKFFPMSYRTTEEVLKQLDEIEYTKGGTATNYAFQTLVEEMIPLTKNSLGPKGIKSVVFVLTDGKANTGGSPEETAKELKEAGVEIYCIGITGDARKNQLYDIASKPKNNKEKFVFILDNYNSLEWVIQEITNGTVDYSKCGLGLRNKVGDIKPQARIIGGESVNEPWPWMAGLYLSTEGSPELKCGGSVIGQRYILTAAHCVCEKNTEKPKELSHITVKLGLTDVKNYTYLQQFEIERLVVHPGYNSSNFDYDAAILVVAGSIEYNPYVRPVCLPPADIPDGSSLYNPGEHAYAAGWGFDRVLRGGEFTNVKTLKNLKEIYLPLQTREICLMSFQSFGGKAEKFTDRMICAGTGDEKGDTCTGDSGGPLMQQQLNKLGNSYWTQIGIVSWGINSKDGHCGQKNAYGYYTKVNRIVPWINNVMQDQQRRKNIYNDV